MYAITQSGDRWLRQAKLFAYLSVSHSRICYFLKKDLNVHGNK